MFDMYRLQLLWKQRMDLNKQFMLISLSNSFFMQMIIVCFRLNNKTTEKNKTCINTILQFYNIFYCFQVFLVCLLCLQSDGAVIGENCTVDVDCNYSNGTCAGPTCGCVTTHYIDGTVCTESKPKLINSCLIYEFPHYISEILYFQNFINTQLQMVIPITHH